MDQLIFARQFFGMFQREDLAKLVNPKASLQEKILYLALQNFSTGRFRAFFMHRIPIVLSVQNESYGALFSGV